MKKITFEEEKNRIKKPELKILEELPEDKELKTPSQEREIKAPSTRAERFFGFSK